MLKIELFLWSCVQVDRMSTELGTARDTVVGHILIITTGLVPAAAIGPGWTSGDSHIRRRAGFLLSQTLLSIDAAKGL